MFKDYEDLVKQMEFEMQRCSAEAMRRLIELPSGSHEFWLPKADVYESEEDLIVRMEIAGIKKESLNVALSSDRHTLRVKGNRSEQHIDPRPKVRYYQMEVYFGSFEREIQLPKDISVNAESLSATYRDGFLVVTLPKLKQQISRSIQITEDE